jgi:hypothetical protein
MLRRVFALDNFGWWVPAALVVVGVVTSYLGSMWEWIRFPFYLGVVPFLALGLYALVRQGREAYRRNRLNPSILNLSFLYQKIALLTLMIGVSGVFANLYVPWWPTLPEPILVGLICTACVAIVVVNIVLHFAGRTRRLAEPVDPGPLRFVYRWRNGRGDRRRRWRGR